VAFKFDGKRASEFFLVGGGTPLLFAASWLIRRRFGVDPSLYAVGFFFFYAAYVINDPHFGVTYLLFYRDFRARAFGGAFAPAQRARYLLSGIVVPLALGVWGAFALAERSAVSLGFMIQLMYLLVGWHYAKQGFGVFVVLSGRRGVRFDAPERFALLAHCYLAWAYAWASPADPGSELEEKGVVYTSVAHSLRLERVTHALFLASALPVAFLLVRKWRREGGLPLGTPLVALLCTLWSWTIYSSVDPLVQYAIPALHSIQYLYFVWLLRGNEARAKAGPPLFESRASRLGLLAASALAVGWVLFHGVQVLDGALVPRHGVVEVALGRTPYFAVVFVYVNIHHYFMDHVIWRKDNPETVYLRDVAPAEARGVPDSALADAE
jgi:hypothetical protein